MQDIKEVQCVHKGYRFACTICIVYCKDFVHNVRHTVETKDIHRRSDILNFDAL